MAQAKQDLQAIINAAAEKEGLDPELLQKIGGAESGFRAGAKNPKSTAKGLFQFVDKTWAEMGGKPGEQYNPQKNAELGARYVKRNRDMLTQSLGREPSYGEVYAAHFFGPTGAKALLTKADPNAPIEQSLAIFESPKRVAKVLKQNPNLKGKTTAQVLADLDAKMGSKKPVVQETPTTTTPAAPAKPKMEMFRRPVPRFIRSEAPNLGTGYNAALALMGMTEMGEDQDPLAKAQETVAQAEEENSVADFGQAQKMLAQVQAPNAFANRQSVRMMAMGGEVRHMADGGFMIPTQIPTLRPDDKKYLNDAKAMWDAYTKQAENYNAALNKYNAEVYNPHKAQIEAYNAALERYNSDVYNPYVSQVNAYNNTLAKGVTQDQYYALYPDVQQAGMNAFQHYVDYGYKEGRQMPGFDPKYYLQANPDVAADPVFGSNPFLHYVQYGSTEAEKRSPIRAPSAPKAFSQAAPKPPRTFNQVVPKTPTLTQKEILARQEAAKEQAIKDAEGRKVAIDVVNAPQSFNLAGFGMAGINTPSMFAEGGEAKSEPEKGSAKAMLKEVARSTQYLPADIAGAPVDLINLGLQGVDALTGSKLAQKMPVGGSEYLIDKANKYGLMDKPTGSMTETLTRLGTGVLSPAAGPKAAVAAGKAIKGTAKAALEDLAMAGTGQGGSKFAQTLTEPGTAFAVRPKGGVSLGASSAADVPLTRIDEKLKQTVEGIDTSTEQGKAVANFFDKKMRNFYQQQYGTADDPLFKAILEGRVQPSIANPRLVDEARAGNPEALKDLRNAYDASTNLQILSSRSVLDKLGKHRFDMEGDVRKLIKAQSPNEPTLMTSTGSLNQKEIENYPRMYGPKGFKDIVSEGDLLRLFNQSDLPPHVRQAVVKGEPIYGTTGGTSRMMPVDDIRDYLMTRTPAEIKNMGVADVAAKSQQWHRRMAEARKSPDKFSSKELFQGTAPVLDVDKYKWVDVKTPDALSLEGNIMGHCVGGSNYCNAVSKETTKIVSLRDKKGVPHVTIQLDKTPQGFTRVAQIKGTGNTSPEKYFNEVNAFLEDYSSKLGGNLTITERPSFVPPQWREK